MFSASANNRLWLLSALLTAGVLTACQPPVPNDSTATPEDTKVADTPIIISADSVTMSADYILSIKPSRYQPSIGLQGTIEPIQQARFSAAQDLTVQQILVTKGQWVEKGTPLFIVQPQKSSSDNAGAVKDIPAININNAPSKPSTGKRTDNKLIDDKLVGHNETDQKTEVNPTNNHAETAASSARTSESDPLTANDLSITASNKPSIDHTTANNNNLSSAEPPEETNSSKNTTALITVRASFSGRVDSIYVESAQQIKARQSLLHLSNDNDLRFIAMLPIQAKPQLSVGQTVNFTTDGISDKFSGQISKLLTRVQSDQLLVYVHVINNDASRSKLKPEMLVVGRVNYGQIEVGNIMPERGIHDVDLSVLQKPPYQPLVPLTANVWIIKQDQRLTRQPVEVIEYDPSTGQYLITGISNDSLILLAELPLESAGKKVVIS